MMMERVKPLGIEGNILVELYFSEFFPLEELIAEKIMTRTRYGVTLTKQFKDKITERMKELGMEKKLISNFEDRKYWNIQLGKLWTPIVYAICNHYGYPCKKIRGQIYVSKSHVEQVRTKASAVYVWFSHVRKALKNEAIGDHV